MEKHYLGYRRTATIEKHFLQRNTVLIARYYYMSELKRLRFDDVVLRLSATFFISEYYIMRLLGTLSEQFDAIKKESPTRGELREKWPEWDWS